MTKRNTSSNPKGQSLARSVASKPNDAMGWRKLALQKLKTNMQEAVEALENALALQPTDVTTMELLADTYYKLGNQEDTTRLVHRALAIKPESPHALLLMAHLQLSSGNYDKALDSISRADEAAPNNLEIQSTKANILYRNNRLDEAEDLFEILAKNNPNNYIIFNNLGNVKRDIGKFQEAHSLYENAIKNSKNNTAPFSNLITTLHYRPEATPEEIFDYSRKWESYFKNTKTLKRPVPKNLAKNKKLRIGMFSDGFRRHPVGWMIIAAVENISTNEIELYLYTTNAIVDQVTTRFQKAASKWENIAHLSDEKFAEKILADEIDILIDLSGHNMGNRMKTMVMEPAPLLVKWVGGLINTTGLKAIDYLISDNIETPEGVDHFYTEKLIRLPDDYVCYTPPNYLPEASDQLPALNNGFVTLGCFNNPIKTNDIVLENWAAILHKLPESRLFLKGHQYSSTYLKSLITKKLVNLGIPEERIRIEGPSSHDKLLAAYNEVDIAFDPWPYSGGLTTCEAMIMGVPVVSLPGPTFAGRHSATHLVNAQMPELVVSNWQEYQDRVLELASDLESLKTIRTHLRQIILESNLCDGKRFARNFSNAMRAIWQRYCDGMQPEALNILAGGEAKFISDTDVIDLKNPEPPQDSKDFSFSFKGKIITIDQGGVLPKAYPKLSSEITGALGLVIFDPSGALTENTPLNYKKSSQIIQHRTLGDTGSAILYACMDNKKSSTLTPKTLPVSERDLTKKPNQVLHKISIPSISLDDIEGLDDLDWLLIDENSDPLKTLLNSSKKLAQASIVHIRVDDSNRFKQEIQKENLEKTMESHGFYPVDTSQIEKIGKEKEISEILYLKKNEAQKLLDNNKRQKLAFLLHSVYNAQKLVINVLEHCNDDSVEKYRHSIGVHPEDLPTPPVLTLPPEEAKLVRHHYARSTTILEYGSGGSTFAAGELQNKKIFSVESDRVWAENLAKTINAYNLPSTPKLYWVDIGSTGAWGYPKTYERWLNFPLYSVKIWTEDFFQHPDVVLIDGRFRVACFLATITNIKRPITILFDDYADRPHYHVVENYLKPEKIVGRMAIFEATPGLISAEQLIRDIQLFYKVE